MSSQASCTFKMEPAPVFLFAYITGSVLCAALVAGLSFFDPNFSEARMPVVLETIGYVLVFFGPPYAALFALVMAHYFKYTVTADGVTGQSLLGKPGFVAWADIAEMRPVRVGNLEFVRLISDSGDRPVWLPLFARHASGAEASEIVWGPNAHAAQALGLLQPAAARA
jgi:hypothetical protein